MIKRTKNFLFSISFLFIFLLFILPLKVQAIDGMNIYIENIKENTTISKNNMDINGYITYGMKLKSIDMYLNNESLGQATMNVEPNMENNTYKINFQHSCDISKYKNGEYILKLVATDENDHKEEKKLIINIEIPQEELDNEKNIIQNNLEYTNTKMYTTEKTLAMVDNKATIENVEVSLNGVKITNGTLEQGKTYTIKGYGNSVNGVLYQFWIKDPYTQAWEMIRDYGTGNSMTWTPKRTGKYLVGIHVKDKYSKERLDNHKYVEYNVQQNSSKATIENVEVSLNGVKITNGTLEQGKTYTIKGYGNSVNGVLYQFWIKDPYTQAWEMIRDYGTGNSMTWTPKGAGKYLVGIHVKDKYSKERLDNHKYVEYNVQQNSSKATIENVELNLDGVKITNGTLEQGKTYTIKGYGNSVNGVLYQFWIKNPYTQAWEMIRDYGTGNSMTWTPKRTGKYLVGIHVKDKYSKERLDNHKYVEYNVQQNSSKATIDNVEVSLNGVKITNGTLEQGKTYTIKGYGNSVNGVLYQFWIKDPYTQAWEMIRDYGTGNSMTWTPKRTGKYLVGIHVKDKYSKERLDNHKYVEYNVQQNSSKATIDNVEVSLNGVKITNGTLEQGKAYTIKGYGNSVNGVLYQFWVKNPYTQAWEMIRDYSTGNSMTWTPKRAGKYLVGIHVKDKYSIERLDNHKYVEYSVIGSNKTIVIDPGHGGYDSGAVGPTGVKEKDIALKVSLKLGKILEENGVQVVYTRTSDSVSWPSNESQDLAARTNIANKINPDLFVSIHNNSYTESSNGTETYYYNGSVKGREAAEAVQRELIKAISLYDRGVKTAGYYVLRNTVSPSILVELAFISNRNEEVLLNSDWFQQKCAEAIAKGILQCSFMESNTGDNSKKNYKNSYYNITLDEMVNKQMLDTPAYHTYIPEKNTYEWRYAIVKNGTKGYANDINGANWIQSDEQYEYIKSKVKEYVDPNKQAYDSNGQYQFLQLSYNDCTIASELNKVLQGKGVLEGKGQVFIDAGRESNVSPIYLVAHALLETGNGTSTLAKGVVVNGKTVHNLFGIRAVDSDPIGQGSKYAYDQGWFSVDLAIKGGAKWISAGYINNSTYKQDTLYKMKWNPANPTIHQYATDIRWAYNQVTNIKNVIEQLENSVLNFDIPVFK